MTEITEYEAFLSTLNDDELLLWKDHALKYRGINPNAPDYSGQSHVRFQIMRKHFEELLQRRKNEF